MNPESINEFLHRQPFTPFRIKFTNQETVDIRNPGLAVVTKRDIFIADPSGDRFKLYYLMHVVGLETLDNGHVAK